MYVVRTQEQSVVNETPNNEEQESKTNYPNPENDGTSKKINETGLRKTITQPPLEMENLFMSSSHGVHLAGENEQLNLGLRKQEVDTSRHMERLMDRRKEESKLIGGYGNESEKNYESGDSSDGRIEQRRKRLVKRSSKDRKVEGRQEEMKRLEKERKLDNEREQNRQYTSSGSDTNDDEITRQRRSNKVHYSKKNESSRRREERYRSSSRENHYKSTPGHKRYKSTSRERRHVNIKSRDLDDSSLERRDRRSRSKEVHHGHSHGSKLRTSITRHNRHGFPSRKRRDSSSRERSHRRVNSRLRGHRHRSSSSSEERGRGSWIRGHRWDREHSRRRRNYRSRSGSREYRHVSRRNRSTSSSDSRSPVRHRRHGYTQSDNINCVRILKDWNLKFSGDEAKENPEQFLNKLDRCRRNSNMSDTQIINAVASVMEDRALRWYDTAILKIETWHEFKKSFQRNFIGQYSQYEIMDEIRNRTQGKGETIANYITCVGVLFKYLKRPLEDDEQIEIIRRRLQPEYKWYLDNKRVDTVDDLEHYGRKYERQREDCNRFVGPPTKDKCRIPIAAFTSTKSKVAAVNEVAMVSGEGKNAKKKDKKRKSIDSPTQSQKNELAGIQVQDNQLSNNRDNQQNGNRQQQMRPPQLGPQIQTQQNSQHINQQPQQARQQLERDNRQTQHQQSQQQQNEGRPMGNCRSCGGPGHRIWECTDLCCYKCRQTRHFANSCPLNAQASSCQVCGAKGVTMRNCGNCSKLLALLGNAKAGASGGPTLPNNKQGPQQQ